MFYNSVVNNDQMADTYARAKTRLLLLDYDGVLAPIMPLPEQARPDKGTLQLLERLTADSRNVCVVISGRQRETLENWLGHLPLAFAAEHGLWRRDIGDEWEMTEAVASGWKQVVLDCMRRYEPLIAGAFIEEKYAALALHYRNEPDEEKADALAARLIHDLEPIVAKLSLRILDGKKVVEVLPAGVNKGAAARFWTTRPGWDFIMAAGDDVTDEALFQAVPAAAYSIKVGSGPTFARSTITSQPKFMQLLETLADL
jgi:trehalose 6-phosphate synthase/phosphatase